jgi:DNA-binding CsgD family transcriptional regulator
VICALPLSWTEHPPSSIIIVQQPAIVAAVSLLVESIWDRGADYPSGDQGWQPILLLLGRGMSDSTIADSLGLSLRTVQRRVTEAMDHYGVRSRFELGVAWAQERALQG